MLKTLDYHRKKLTAIVTFLVLFAGLRMTTGSFSILYMLSKGLTLRDVAFIKTWQAVFILIVDLPTAYFADKISRKLFIIMGFLSAALWLMITGFAHNFTVFLIAEGFNALSLACLSGSLMAYLIDYARHHAKISTKDILAHYTKWQFMTMALFAIIGAFIVHFNRLNVWYITGVAVLILTIFAYIVLPHDPQHERQPETKKQKNLPLMIKKSLQKHVFITVVCLILLSVFYQIIIQFWQPVVAPFFKQFHHGSLWNGFYFVALLVVQAGSGKILQKCSHVMVFIQSFAVLCGLCVLYIFSHLFTQIFPLLFILLFFFMMRFLMTYFQSTVHDHIPSHIRATYDASLSFIVRIALLASLPLFGAIFQGHGFHTIYPITLILLGLCLIPLLLFFKKSSPRHA